MPHPVSLNDVLDTLVLFANAGGASASHVAWDLAAEEHQVIQAWQQAIKEGLIAPAGHDHGSGVFQLTAAGWAVHNNSRARA